MTSAHEGPLAGNISGKQVDGPASQSYTAGTLVYTRAGLIALFGWLLWGDFIFNLMESVMPLLLPLLLKAHGASNREIAIIVSTLAMAVNAALNPFISYASDRYRSRWGRRRPFIVVTTPFLMVFPAATPFAPEILHWASSFGPLVRLLALALRHGGRNLIQLLCFWSERASSDFVSQLGRILNTGVIDFGFSGNAKDEPEVARLISEINAEMFVLDYVAHVEPEELRTTLPLSVSILR